MTRGRRSSALGALLALAISPLAAHAQPILMPEVRAAPTWQARVDAMLDAAEAEDALSLLRLHLAASPEDAGGHRRAARACFQLGLLADERDTANDWYRRGVAHADRALASAPDDREALRWAVAVTGSLANAPGVGPRETARAATRTWDLAKHLLELHAEDDVAHSALGTLHAEVMTLSSFERFLARAFLGGLVSAANWDDALTHQRRAVALRPDEVLYRLELGKALAWRGLTTEGLGELDAALALPARSPLDEARHDEAGMWRERFLREVSR